MPLRITITNTFHDTSVHLILRGKQLTGTQIRKANESLCPSKPCKCRGLWQYERSGGGEAYISNPSCVSGVPVRIDRDGILHPEVRLEDGSTLSEPKSWDWLYRMTHSRARS
jgi:hypothetical protein